MSVLKFEIARLNVGEISISLHDDGEFLLTLTKPRLNTSIHLTPNEFSSLREIISKF